MVLTNQDTGDDGSKGLYVEHYEYHVLSSQLVKLKSCSIIIYLKIHPVSNFSSLSNIQSASVYVYLFSYNHGL